MKKLLIAFILFLFSTTAHAQIFSPPLGIQDEDDPIERPINVIKCSGVGISCEKSGTTGVLTVSGVGGDHDAVTLSVAADTVLELTMQEISLNAQTANYIWAGPASGAAATPTFRTLVDDDIPDDITIEVAGSLVGTGDSLVSVGGINWNIDNLIDGSAINWVNLEGFATDKFLYSQSDGSANWIDLPAQEVNWDAIEDLIGDFQINWSDVKQITANNINWASMDNFTEGYFPKATSTSVNWVSLTGNLAGVNHRFGFNIPDPNAYYDIDAEFLIWAQTDAALTITSIKCSLDADPTTELDWDLKFADAFIGLANATVIDAIDTTAGATSITSGFDDATVPAGKDIYVSFGADPDGDIKQAGCTVTFDYD